MSDLEADRQSEYEVPLLFPANYTAAHNICGWLIIAALAAGTTALFDWLAR